MSLFQIDRRFFESPHPAVLVLMTINVVVYAICVSQSGTANIPTGLLFRNGAMYPGAIAREEYWRLITAGFLHASLLHVVSNMFCLVFWGGHDPAARKRQAELTPGRVVEPKPDSAEPGPPDRDKGDKKKAEKDE